MGLVQWGDVGDVLAILLVVKGVGTGDFSATNIHGNRELVQSLLLRSLVA